MDVEINCYIQHKTAATFQYCSNPNGQVNLPLNIIFFVLCLTLPNGYEEATRHSVLTIIYRANTLYVKLQAMEKYSVQRKTFFSQTLVSLTNMVCKKPLCLSFECILNDRKQCFVPDPPCVLWWRKFTPTKLKNCFQYARLLLYQNRTCISHVVPQKCNMAAITGHTQTLTWPVTRDTALQILTSTHTHPWTHYIFFILIF